jgi:hypothetical protein
MLALIGLVGAAACSGPAPRVAPTTTLPALPAPADESATTPTPTLSSPATTAPSTRMKPVPGSTDATPPPAIHASGTDYPAIAASLFRYRHWLLAHHPDPALADQAFARGTLAYVDAVAQLRALRAARRTLVSLDQRFEFRTTSVHGSLMTLVLHEVITEERLVDRQGRIVSATHFDEPNNYTIIMTSDRAGRWRLADITDMQPEPTIPL